jgi:excisionase family DNA binding protein
MSHTPTDPLLSVIQVATRLGLKASTIRKKILLRDIAYVKLGRSVRIPESEVERLILNGYRPVLRGPP